MIELKNRKTTIFGSNMKKLWEGDFMGFDKNSEKLQAQSARKP